MHSCWNFNEIELKLQARLALIFLEVFYIFVILFTDHEISARMEINHRSENLR